MAVWQFTFFLVPREGVLRVHGKVPVTLTALAEKKLGEEPNIIDLEKESNFWGEKDARQLAPKFKKLLPMLKSWAEDAVMFGDHEVHDVTIWADDLTVRFDVRVLSNRLIEGITEIADVEDLLIVISETGEVIEPKVNFLVERIKRSRAAKFLCDPRGFLESLPH